MPKIKYQEIKMSAARLDVVAKANAIIEEYAAQGFDLTLRQLYYQFVARAFIANKQSEYKRLGDIINDARLCGLIDWERILDRTRAVRTLASWGDPSEIVGACAEQFRIDMWKHQSNRVEVWIEKDALVGVIEGICEELRVSYFSCRGYTSQSEMWAAAQRLLRYRRSRQTPVILHFGDHDPSGIDMSRDIQDRLELFMRKPVEFHRLALNMAQVQQYNPPPNPAKTTDSRYESYMREHGDESWELDALEPRVMADLIRDEVYGYRDVDTWEADEAQEEEMKKQLSGVSAGWLDVVKYLKLQEGIDE